LLYSGGKNKERFCRVQILPGKIFVEAQCQFAGDFGPTPIP
jgi:hypothetical protein